MNKLLTASLLLSIAGTSCLAQAPEFRRMGGLPGWSSSSAVAISADGQVAAGSVAVETPDGPVSIAVRWNIASGLVALPTLPDRTGAQAADISPDGQFIVGEAFPDSRAVRWTGTTITDLGIPANAASSAARAVSADGQTVVGLAAELPDEFFRAAIYRDNAWTIIGGFPGGLESNCTDVAADGLSVVGLGDVDLGLSGFLANAPAFELIDPGFPPALNGSVFSAISDDGATVVGWGAAATGDATQSFLYRPSEIEPYRLIPLVPGTSDNFARTISADGARVGGEASNTSLEVAPFAFIWTDETGGVDLAALLQARGVDLQGMTLTSVEGLSEDGQFAVGTGVNAQGQTEGWWARLPATLTLACGPSDLGGEGGALGSDGVLDNNDFIIFIQLFFEQDPAADLGSEGGAAGADGNYDNNDFIVFISAFFAGC